MKHTHDKKELEFALAMQNKYFSWDMRVGQILLKIEEL